MDSSRDAKDIAQTAIVGLVRIDVHSFFDYGFVLGALRFVLIKRLPIHIHQLIYFASLNI